MSVQIVFHICPSSCASAFSGYIVHEIDIDGLSDNDNYDGERRLMYVALTRAERFLVISHSARVDQGLFLNYRIL